MTSPSLTTLFNTLAQVSFTISGLMAVAIAGDSKRRDYWFGHEARSLYVRISFLLLVLPGFISIGGLIPLPGIIPPWPIVTGFYGAIYFILSINFYFMIRKFSEPEEYKRLEKKFSKVNTEMGVFGLSMIVIGLIGFGNFVTPSVDISSFLETVIGMLLFFGTVFGAIAAINLLKANELHSDVDDEFPKPDQTKQHSLVVDQNPNVNRIVGFSLLAGIIGILIGIFVNDRNS